MTTETLAGSAAKKTWMSASGYNTYPIGNAFDGSTSNYYVSDSACDTSSPYACTGLWIQWSFPARMTITGVRFHSHSTYPLPATIKVYVSDTGAFAGEETLVDTITYTHPGSSVWGAWVSFARASGPYLRMVITAATASGGDVRIKEIELERELPLQAVLDQTWSLAPVVTGYVEQLYDLSTSWGNYVGSHLDQVYSLATPVDGYLEQLWSIRLGAALAQHWEDAPVVAGSLVQYWGDAALVTGVLEQEYGDATVVAGNLEQSYHLPAALTGILEQRYAITSAQVQGYIAQVWNLHQRDLVRSVLAQPWIIAAEASLVEAVAATVTIAGRSVEPVHINVEADRSSYHLTGEIHFHDQAEYARVDPADHDEVVITVAGTGYHLVVLRKFRARTRAGTSYVIDLASRSALLQAPWADPVDGEIASDMASAIASDMADLAGVAVDWGIVDWQVSAGRLYGNNEAPIEVIRKLARAAGGRMRTAPGGTLEIVPRYPAPLPQWDTATVAATLTDNDNFYSASESPVDRDGYNRYLVSDRLPSNSRADLESEEISPTEHVVRAWVVPWSDAATLSLAATRSGVEIEVMSVDLDGDDTEIEEVVEIVGGAGSTAKPISVLLETEYLDTALGAVTTAEDGTIATETQAESLLRVRYRAYHLKWRVTGEDVDTAQLVLEDTA